MSNIKELYINVEKIYTNIKKILYTNAKRYILYLYLKKKTNNRIWFLIK